MHKNVKNEDDMKRYIVSWVLLILLGMVPMGYSAEAFDQSILPELLLATPENEVHRDYLGLTTQPGETFKISDIKADLLVIELFSMYCPYCQKEAPLVNELHRKMEEKSAKGLSIKIIGLGASNSQFEVEHFGQTYGVLFPLFPDKDMSMYKALGGAGTPGFVGYKLQGNPQPVNVLRNSGGFYSAEEFLQDLLDNSELTRISHQ